MTYSSAEYQEFLKTRRNFFLTTPTIESAKTIGEQAQYPFLVKNRLLIEKEFEHLSAALEGHDPKDLDVAEFWLYCYSRCLMLQRYYEQYDKKDKASYYEAQAKLLHRRCTTGDFSKNTPPPLPFIKKISTDIASLISTPAHTTAIEGWLGFLNVNRLRFAFCRLTLITALPAMSELDSLKNTLQALHLRTDIPTMVSILKAPTYLFNFFSVALFTGRLIVYCGLTIKHTCFPTRDEQQLKWTARLYQEGAQRLYTLLNDIAWGTVNLFTNYPQILGLSNAMTGWITMAFLAFDAALLMHRHYNAAQEYRIQLAYYRGEKEHYRRLKSSEPKYGVHCDLLDEQLKQLEISHQKTSLTLRFNIGAALLFFGSFSLVVLLATTPAQTALCFFLCALAGSMYLTADNYGASCEKSLIVEQLKLDNRDFQKAEREMNQACSDWRMAMTTNTLAPLFIMTAIALSWPMAILTTAAYIGYESGYTRCAYQSTMGYFKPSTHQTQSALSSSPSL